jgi:hypothetical protein
MFGASAIIAQRVARIYLLLFVLLELCSSDHIVMVGVNLIEVKRALEALNRRCVVCRIAVHCGWAPKITLVLACVADLA